MRKKQLPDLIHLKCKLMTMPFVNGCHLFNIYESDNCFHLIHAPVMKNISSKKLVKTCIASFNKKSSKNLTEFSKQGKLK
jgi:hypothetical protein